MQKKENSILIVEDDAFILQTLKSVFSKEGYGVFTAVNGREGAEVALREKPDVIICDIAMPGSDGFEVLHAVRAHLATQRTPFIFLTAKASPTEQRKAEAEGANAYLPKPVWPKKIIKEVAKYV